jgi:hypothetical protein
MQRRETVGGELGTVFRVTPGQAKSLFLHSILLIAFQRHYSMLMNPRGL